MLVLWSIWALVMLLFVAVNMHVMFTEGLNWVNCAGILFSAIGLIGALCVLCGGRDAPDKS